MNSIDFKYTKFFKKKILFLDLVPIVYVYKILYYFNNIGNFNYAPISIYPDQELTFLICENNLLK